MSEANLTPEPHERETQPEEQPTESSESVIRKMAEDLPTPIRQAFSMMMTTTRKESARGPIHTIADKLTPEHIDRIIEEGAKDDERQFKAHKFNSIVTVVILVIALAFAAFMLVFFKDSEHFITIISSIFSFLGGLGVAKVIRRGNDG